jgi:hypothetical protein
MGAQETRTDEERLDKIESRVAIAGLVADYCHGLDRRDIEKFMSLWHSDAESIIPGGRGEFRGLDEIRESQAVIAKVWRSTYHWTTNHTIEFESSDVAKGRSNVFAMLEHHDLSVCFVGGTYWDSYERRDGRWKFSRRLTDRHFVSAPVDIPLLAPH